jgi:hypothetical protein
MQNAEAIQSQHNTVHTVISIQYSTWKKEFDTTTYLRIIRGLVIRAYLPGILMTMRQWTAFPTASVSGGDKLSLSFSSQAHKYMALLTSTSTPRAWTGAS